ncbi:hypothetical protein V6Z11_A11G323300 [Gossypium hirsutum]
MWYKLIPSCYISQFFWMNLINWIIGNMENNVGLHVGSIECGIYFAVLCWFLWKNKNRVIFQHDSVHPKEGRVKVNTDEALNDNRNYSTIGGVLHDCHGNWIAGLYRSVGRCPSYSKVILKSDSKIVIDMLNADYEDVMMASLIRGIKVESRQFSMVKFQHVFREANKVADCIAKTCIENALELVIFELPLNNVIKMLLDDKAGNSYVRTNRS